MLKRKTVHNKEFAALLADEYILMFLFAISSDSVRRNSIRLYFLSSSSVFQSASVAALTQQQFQPWGKP
jgi:hypothetical protein